MGVYKRGDTWGISYFHNGKRIRKVIGANKKKAEAAAPSAPDSSVRSSGNSPGRGKEDEV